MHDGGCIDYNGPLLVKDAYPIIEGAYVASLQQQRTPTYVAAGPQARSQKGEQRELHFEHTPNSSVCVEEPDKIENATGRRWRGRSEVIKRHTVMRTKHASSNGQQRRW